MVAATTKNTVERKIVLKKEKKYKGAKRKTWTHGLRRIDDGMMQGHVPAQAYP